LREGACGRQSDINGSDMNGSDMDGWRNGKGTDGCGGFGVPTPGCGVSEARFARDEAYRAMRRAVPDLERPAADRGPLTDEQARTVARYLAAEDDLRRRRDDVRRQGVHAPGAVGLRLSA
jgi:hypothetical protein